MIILGIESSCDETGAAIAELTKNGVIILSETKASSAELQNKYGGVIPELAAREQTEAIIPVINEAFELAKIEPKEIEGIAISYGPGLIGSLLVGVETAKALAWAWDKPLYKVNHMVAHVFANWINPNEENWQAPELPALALIVSGGHTDLVLMKNQEDWKRVGGTRDDAVGEAFDKAARALGLPYPGGPEIQKAALKAKGTNEYKLPRPMIRDESLEMSFSGIKTALVDLITKKKEVSEEDRAEIAAEFTEAVVEVLVSKTRRAVEVYEPKSVILAGGVSANQKLRDSLASECQKMGVKFYRPDLKYCTDNAAMIASAGLMRPVETEKTTLRPDPSLIVG